jgi:hypothetical protein
MDVYFLGYGVCILHKCLVVVGVCIYCVSVCCRIYFFLHMNICFFSSFLEYVSIYVCMENISFSNIANLNSIFHNIVPSVFH